MELNSCLILAIRWTVSVYIPQVLFVCVVVCFIITVHGVSIWKCHMSYPLVLIAGEMLRNTILTSYHYPPLSLALRCP